MPASAALAFSSNRDGNDAIYVANADGSGVTRIAAGTSPAWSPDGRRLAFVEIGGGRPSGIVVVEEDGTRRGLRAGRVWGPAWSPDGTRIAFSISGVTDGLYVMNPDGSDARRIVPPDCAEDVVGGYDPAWSPDGETIAFIGATTWIWAGAICLVGADGSDLRLLRVGAADPAWSPDGTRVAFAGGAAIWIVGADGSDAEIYAQGLAHDPSWTPDGRSILFAALPRRRWYAPRHANGRRIVIATGVGSEQRQLIPDHVDARLPDYNDEEPVWRPGR